MLLFRRVAGITPLHIITRDDALIMPGHRKTICGAWEASPARIFKIMPPLLYCWCGSCISVQWWSTFRPSLWPWESRWLLSTQTGNLWTLWNSNASTMCSGVTKSRTSIQMTTKTPPWICNNFMCPQKQLFQDYYYFEILLLPLNAIQRVLVNGCKNCISQLFPNELFVPSPSVWHSFFLTQEPVGSVVSNWYLDVYGNAIRVWTKGHNLRLILLLLLFCIEKDVCDWYASYANVGEARFVI